MVPVGGGGMLSGICIAAKALKPDIKIYAAEPLNADDCARSFVAKERIPQTSKFKLESQPTLGDMLQRQFSSYDIPVFCKKSCCGDRILSPATCCTKFSRFEFVCHVVGTK